MGACGSKASSPAPPPSERGRVAVVGGGAAGAACAWSLARSGASVVLLERAETLGGVATTADGGGARFNDGVQGGAPRWVRALRMGAPACARADAARVRADRSARVD